MITFHRALGTGTHYQPAWVAPTVIHRELFGPADQVGDWFQPD